MGSTAGPAWRLSALVIGSPNDTDIMEPEPGAEATVYVVHGFDATDLGADEALPVDVSITAHLAEGGTRRAASGFPHALRRATASRRPSLLPRDLPRPPGVC